MNFRGIHIELSWRAAFWVALILTVLASAVHALVA